MGRAPKRNRPDRRLPILLVAFFLGLSAVGLRLAWVQVVKAEDLTAQAERQRRRDIVLSPQRGAIYDREGQPLAVSVEAKTVYAVPTSVEDREGTARALAKTLGGDVRTYRRKLAKKSSFVYISRKVDLERAAALEKLDLAGIAFLEDSKRIYPKGSLAGQILGFVGVDDEGLAGLERYYDEVLAGVPGRLNAERDPFGRIIPGGVTLSEKPTNGRSIRLTIDADIQYQAQIKLAETVKTFKAKGGSVIVMDPRSGEIYAMASAPFFDPNRYGEAKAEAIRLRPVLDAYEPGSTIKSMTAAAVIEEGLYQPKSKFTLPPTLRIGGRTIHESHGRGTVTMTLTDIVTQSSNVGAVKLGMALGANGIYDYFSRFGLTEHTGIDYPGEAKGWLPPTSQWSASSIGNIPFGQGISTTPLQLARAMCALTGDGQLPTPHLLASVDGSETPVWPRERAVSAKTVSKMSKVLSAVVTEGTGDAAAVPGYTVAGKTGTAQKARTDGRGYAAGKYVASFTGFLPAEDPRLVILVTIDEPRNAIYGGTVAAPVFAELGKFSVAHLKIPPSPNAPSGGTESDGDASRAPARTGSRTGSRDATKATEPSANR